MKPIRIALLAALVAATCSLAAIASPASGGQGLAQAGSTPTADFGSPPSGQIPILYNDHHVYTKPDVLKQARVLAALVKGGTLLIPLRSMFEQMGATVSYDAGSKTATVSKPGAEVKVTVGKPEVVINGESRPLDVPPMMYQGSVLVPVRVISEGMGAYVLWVADRHLVVVRYIPATPPPAPPPATAPPPPPTPAPTPKPEYKDLFVAGDYIISPHVYNAFANSARGTGGTFSVRGAWEFDISSIPLMIEGDYNNWQYPHNCGVPQTIATPGNAAECFVTAIGGRFQTYVPAFTAVDRDVDVRLGVRIFNPRVYIAAGYIWGSNNYGYPNLNAVGVGLEKLPDLDQALSFYGSVYYYPNFKGTYTNNAINTGPTSYGVGYNLLKYKVGLNWVVFGPVFLDGGWSGENRANKNNFPIGANYNGGYVGLGFKF
ncbi:MAG: copper amine oxidase N-terminal domain-containing protein [Candidatus Eremiobacteraeota bacterium]|nr:copper amine oxidase N-terminal domain-containing protein [Candidatus Eremiobacteraeota bacterium]MBV8372144.1 copper amine oxidase N-terminal domain-containing protein [Candidatus Eremiobacteraeota bacterium]